MWFGHIDAGEEHSLWSQVPFLQSGAALLHQIQRVLQVSQAGCSLESRSVLLLQASVCRLLHLIWYVMAGAQQRRVMTAVIANSTRRPIAASAPVNGWVSGVSLVAFCFCFSHSRITPSAAHREVAGQPDWSCDVLCCAVLTHDVLFVQLEKWNEQRESGTWPGRYWASTLDFLKRVTFLCPDVVCVFLFLKLSAGSLMQVSLPQVETACAIRLEFMTSGQVKPFSWVWLYRVQHSSCKKFHASLRCRNRPLSQTVWFNPNLGSCAYCTQFSVHD